MGLRVRRDFEILELRNVKLGVRILYGLWDLIGLYRADRVVLCLWPEL